MREINRRQFGKLAAGAALAVPLAPELAWPQPSMPAAAPAGQSSELPAAQASKAEPKLKLTPEQEEAVKKAIERRDRQLAAIRARSLPYDAEPAFVFRVHQRPRGVARM